MKTFSRMAWQKAAIVVAVAAFGCGEDGKGIQDTDNCPPQSLYKYVFADAGPPGSGGGAGHWSVRKPDGSKFTQAEYTQLKTNLDTATRLGKEHNDVHPPLPPESTGVRCLTPYGTALSLDAGK